MSLPIAASRMLTLFPADVLGWLLSLPADALRWLNGVTYGILTPNVMAVAGVMVVAGAVAAASPRAVRWLSLALAGLSGLSLLSMVLLTCVDVILRAVGKPFLGAYDLVAVLAVMVLAGAMPYTTSSRGHVAVEFFAAKLGTRAHSVLSFLVHLLGAVLFGILCWYSMLYGRSLLRIGQVTATLELPVFWLPWVMGFSFGVVAMVLMHDLLRPRQMLVKP